MAVSLPNGVIISLGTAYGADLTVTALSNANPALATSVGHGLIDDDVVVVTSGWAKLNDRVVKVDQKSVDTFELEGINSSDTALYPAASGTGVVNQVTTWTQITQILDLSTSGGEMGFVTYSFLEQDFETQLPTQASPMTLTMTIADDPALTGYQALATAAEARDARAVKLAMPDGSIIYYYGYISFNTTPSMTKNQVAAVRATFNLLSRPVRYAAP